LKRRIDDYMGAPRPRSTRSSRASTEGCRDVEEAVRATVEAVLQESIRALNEEVRRLREEVARLRAEIARLQAGQAQARRQTQVSRGKSRLADKLLDILSQEGYILASESKEKLGVGPYKLRELAAQTGSKVIALEGDLAVIDPEAYREFLMLLASSRSSDPGEAARRMGKYKRLFEKLRASSMVYYDARRGAWRLLE